MTETCKYSNKDEAIKICEFCDDGLCSGCGYTIDGMTLCNECYNDYVQEGQQAPSMVLENVGFWDNPHYELVPRSAYKLA